MKTKYNNVKVKSLEELTDVKEQEETKTKIQPVIRAKRAKKPLMNRVLRGIFGGDGSGSSVMGYLGKEVILPAIKNIIVDTITSGINMAVYGSKDNRRYSNRGYTGYNDYSSRSYSGYNDYSRRSNVRSSNVDVDDYEIDNRNDAINILNILTETADKYGSVTIADYYDSIGVETKITDNNFGWIIDDMVKVNVVSTRGGRYRLTLPRPRQI